MGFRKKWNFVLANVPNSHTVLLLSTLQYYVLCSSEETDRLSSSFRAFGQMAVDCESLEIRMLKWPNSFISQFPGEALILPAGAPRQAKPILSCITVSSDFLSTESAPRSAFMVRQMRHVVSTPPTQAHTNTTTADNADPQVTTGGGGGGDKMQIKTLIYHSVKNAVSTILSSTALKTDK